jgi:hypothetical protein
LAKFVVIAAETKQEMTMTTLFKTAVGATIATMIATATPALAGGWSHHWNGPVAAGVIGGLALGAIATGAYGSPAYEDAPIYGDCYLTRRPAYDAWGNFVGYRRVRVCD